MSSSLQFFFASGRRAIARRRGVRPRPQYALALVVYREVIREKTWLRWLFLLPLKDVLGFLVWLWSFAGDRVRWRGTCYRITRGGKMTPV